MTHCTICGDPISGVDQADEAWCAECFERNLAHTLEPGQGLGWRPAAPHWPHAAESGQDTNGEGEIDEGCIERPQGT